MTLDPQTLALLQAQLEKEQSELEKELSVIANPVDKKTGVYETKFEELGEDMEDNAEEVEEYTDNLAVKNTLEERLKATKAALEKIPTGRYGFCDLCQQPIDIERLKANPAAATCVHCQK